MVPIIFVLLWTVLSAAPLENYPVTRDYFGDVFSLPEDECDQMACERGGRFSAPIPGDGCMCQCAPSHYIYRDDIEDCVEYVAECPLAVFLRPYMAEKLPVVSLPLTGQLVYPGAHFQFPDVGNMSSLSTCEVSNTEYMTSKGWLPVTQDNTKEPLFGVFQDGGNTFLQWLGKDSQRIQLQHHLVLIRLRCQDQGVTFDSCSALRIGWSPGLNVALTEPFWIRRNNFIIIGLCVGILGLTYVFAICIYMKVRRRKAKKCSSNHIGSHQSAFRDLRNKKDPRKVPQVYNVMERDLWIHQKNCLKAEKYPSSTYFIGRRPKEIESRNDDNCLSKQDFVLSKEYFEPEMLASPPPLATELLHRVRQTISLTMRRIRNLKYRPTLVIIPEEDYYYTSDQKSVASSTETQKEQNLEAFTCPVSVPASITEHCLPTPCPPPRKVRPRLKANDNSSDSSPEEGSGQITKFDQFREDLYQKVNKLKNIRNGLDTVHVLEGEEEIDFDGPTTSSGGYNRISRRTLLTHIEAGINDDEDSVSNQDDEKSQNKDLEEIVVEDNSTNSQADTSEKETCNLIEDYLSIDIEELYRQWSSQLALKLLEQKVPNVEFSVEEKDKSILAQFLKEFRNAFGRFGHLNIPKSHDMESKLQHDNWTLRKERDSERSSIMSSRMSDASTFRLDSLTDFSESSIEGQTSQDSLTNSEELRPEMETSGVSSGGDEPHSLEKSTKSLDSDSFPCSHQQMISCENTSSVDIDSLEDSDNSLDFHSSSDASDLSCSEESSSFRGKQNLEVRKELKSMEWKHVCEKKHQDEEDTGSIESKPKKRSATNRKRKYLGKNKRPVNGTCKDYIRYCKSSRTGTFTPNNSDEINIKDIGEMTERCTDDDNVTLIGIAPSK